MDKVVKSHEQPLAWGLPCGIGEPLTIENNQTIGHTSDQKILALIFHNHQCPLN